MIKLLQLYLLEKSIEKIVPQIENKHLQKVLKQNREETIRQFFIRSEDYKNFKYHRRLKKLKL